jgi:hypothetical protein
MKQRCSFSLNIQPRNPPKSAKKTSIGWQSIFAEPDIVLIREGRGKKPKTQRKR